MDPSGMSSNEWHEVMDAMEEVGPYYERVNWLITFGMVDKWRQRVASLASEDDVVLEIGSGPGNFTKHLTSKAVYALEPSSELAHASRAAIDLDRVTLMRGVGEKIPLSDGQVDKVFCVFSFRDFFDRRAAAVEMHRVLKDGGEAVVVDMAKPRSGPLAKMIEFHVKHLVPPLTRIAVPSVARERWTRDPYRTFVETYQGYASTDVVEGLLRSNGFEDVKTDFLELGGATMTRGKKPWKSTS